MKRVCFVLVGVALTYGIVRAQVPGNSEAKPAAAVSPVPSAARITDPSGDDLNQLTGDVQQLKVLLNQMRTNMAFVQSSQSPLKHQFELETDAWQIVIAQLERRIRRLDAQRQSAPARP